VVCFCLWYQQWKRKQNEKDQQHALFRGQDDEEQNPILVRELNSQDGQSPTATTIIVKQPNDSLLTRDPVVEEEVKPMTTTTPATSSANVDVPKRKDTLSTTLESSGWKLVEMDGSGLSKFWINEISGQYSFSTPQVSGNELVDDTTTDISPRDAKSHDSSFWPKETQGITRVGALLRRSIVRKASKQTDEEEASSKE
jgi:hypothetical protein